MTSRLSALQKTKILIEMPKALDSGAESCFYGGQGSACNARDLPLLISVVKIEYHCLPLGFRQPVQTFLN